MPVYESLPPDTGQGAIGRSGELDHLAPTARMPERVRLRVGVGATIVLVLAALAVTVVVSAVGQQSDTHVVSAHDSGSAASSAGDPGTAGIAATDGASASSGVGRVPGDSSAGGTVSGSVIFVHVLGAVEHPGLFELPEGARVIDAVAAAGGMTDLADPGGANLARRLSDGEQLYLAQVGEAVPGAVSGTATGGGIGQGAAGSAGPAGVAGAVVNLNTATVADLDTLPRIGPAMAQRILDYREANGPFTSTDELRNITGIGDKTFDALKALVTV